MNKKIKYRWSLWEDNANEVRRNIILKNQRGNKISETDQLKWPEENFLGINSRMSKDGE